MEGLDVVGLFEGVRDGFEDVGLTEGEEDVGP